ncbi:MAG: hypothetical protein J5761_03060 [Paludibacteraceae bacterium]|nr:hypothetical protein [Paludibacteraceae bacterium]
MNSFDYIWTLLEPKKEYEPVRNRCLLLWNTFTLEQQRRIYQTIRNRKKEHLFVDYNPLFAIERFSRAPQKQTLSFNDYYIRFGTTEEKDGWRRVFLPDKQTTIYIKQ